MKETALLGVFMHAGFFLAVAALIIPLLNRFKVPAVLGYLAAGIIFGPQGLGMFVDSFPALKYITLQEGANLQLLSELGIVFLLFVIGLELTPRKLWQMRTLVFKLGSAQVLITSCLIGGIAYVWGNSLQASVLLGLGLSLSSTAIITQWLHEKKLFNTEAGQTSFSILLLQDLAVIPILILITVFTAEASQGLAGYISILLVKMICAVVLIIAFGKWIVRPLFSFSNKYGGAEVFIALSFLVIVITSSIAGMAGLSMALGAFIGGLLLAETQYSHEISSIIVPFKSMLLGIFFMAFGMSIDIQFIADKPFWLLLSVVGLMSIKSAVIYLLCRVWNRSKSAAVETALLLPQAGEFGLLVVGASLTSGLLANDVGQFMFLTIGLTMLLTPVIAPLSQRVATHIRSKFEADEPVEKDTTPSDELSGHVVIMGYGRMGKTVCEILSAEGIRTIAFEKDATSLKEAQKNNAPVYFGDVTHKRTLKHAHLSKAASVVITIDDPSVIKRIVKNIRDISADIPLIVRTHKSVELSGLSETEHIHIVPEYLSTSHILAQKALEASGFTAGEAYAITDAEA